MELIGKPNKISILDKNGFITFCDFITLRIEFSDNKICFIDINRISNQKRHSITILTEKNLFLWESEKLYKYNKQTRKLKIIYESKKTPLEIECEEFLKFSDAPKKDFSNAKKAVQVLQILEKFRLLN